ncbi:ROK family transcriptional regulator [Actinophytocola gossypii]|uniref:ROK family transcriptional regulator n=1 Tax=Actinophytocola gossypii TaxID=2812003 RepID=A0ABT2J4M1_9PSEU|nr:ROK family transcriptional regulator [Actinophytocola gossypii]MCT2582817.1 ROK family transcriptional regulator [Actinophytocola gossypii]
MDSRRLGELNEAAALGHLLERGPLTRGDLRELTGLAKPTASDVVRRLRAAGLVRVVGRTSRGRGPNAEVYAVDPDAAFAAAVSVRAKDSTLVTAVCDLAGEVRARTETPVDFAHADAAPAVHDAVRVAARRAGVALRRIGHVQLGVPGSVPEGAEVIHHVDVPGWGRPGVVAEIRKRLRTRVTADNDVNLAAVAERRHGIASGVDGFALLWLGEEGLGLAIDLGGTLLRGARGGAGEVGYMPVGLPPAGGVHDFHDLVSGSAVRDLARRHGIRSRTGHAAVTRAVSTATSEATGTAAGKTAGAAARTVDTAASTGAAADEFLDALAVRVAVGVAVVVAVLDPPLVVLAGEVGRAGGGTLATRVERALRELSVLHTEIATTGVREDAVVLGALDTSLASVRRRLTGLDP